MPKAADEFRIVEPLCAVFRRRLKSEGLRYTPERARILDAVVETDGLFEADALMASMRNAGHRVSKATVYRTLRLLLDAGILQRVLFDDDHARFLLAYGRRPSDLLVHLDTGEVEAIDLPELIELRDRMCAARGLRAKGHRLQVYAVGGTGEMPSRG